MPDQVPDKRLVVEQDQTGVAEMGPPSSPSPSDLLLRRIATLLFLLVAGMLTVFGYYASSICVTVVLAAFFAILVDPVVVRLEKLRLPRGVAAAVVVLAGMSLVGLLGRELYGRAVTFAEELLVYTSKIQQTLEPIIRYRQRALKSAAVSRTDLFACAPSRGGCPAVQYAGPIYRHHPDNSSAACRVCESSYSQIHCHSGEYRAGGGDGWDSLLGLVMGCDGLAAGCAAYRVCQARCGLASILRSLLEHAGTGASPNSTLGAIQRNRLGSGDSLFAWPPPRSAIRRQRTAT
jgi:hypothetical protein